MDKLKALLFKHYYIGTYCKTPLYFHGTTPAFLLGLFLLTLLTSGIAAAADFSWVIVNLYLCVVLHEYGHVYAAQRFGRFADSVTLLPFGGMATLDSNWNTPREEITIAIAGPLTNFILAVISFPICWLLLETPFASIPATFFGVNVVLGIFNLIPAYPMDGGRIFRGCVWNFKGYYVATQWAINLSKVFIPLFVIVGLLTAHYMLLVIALFIWAYCHQNPEGGGMM